MKRIIGSLISVIAVVAVLAACATPAPQVVEVTRVVTEKETVVVKEEVEKVVKETIVVEKEKEVTKVVEVEKEVTATPRPPVTIRLMNFSQEQLEFFEDTEDVFNQEYPWITLEIETLAQGDYDSTLPLMFQGGDSPDIFIFYHQAPVQELLDRGWIQPWDETVLPPDFADRFPNTFGLMEPLFGMEGKLYGMPAVSEAGPYGHGYMWYNKTVFENAGLDPVEDVPKTWDEMLEVCRTIRATGVYCLANPNSGVSELHRILVPMLAVSGASWESRETGLSALSGPEFTEAIEFLRRFYVEDLAYPGNNDKAFCRAAVAAGQAAIYFDGGWMPAVFAESYGYLDPGVAAPPAPDENGYRGKITTGMDQPRYFLSSQSENPYEATLFMEWMTRPDGWWASQFFARGFGWLAYGRAERYITNPLQKALIPLSEQMRVIGPDVAMKCPDVMLSEAEDTVSDNQPISNAELINDYLQNGGDWVAMAKELDDAKDEIFLATLEEERAAGLDVSAECWANPDWDPTTNFDWSVYFED